MRFHSSCAQVNVYCGAKLALELFQIALYKLENCNRNSFLSKLHVQVRRERIEER